MAHAIDSTQGGVHCSKRPSASGGNPTTWHSPYQGARGAAWLLRSRGALRLLGELRLLPVERGIDLGDPVDHLEGQNRQFAGHAREHEHRTANHRGQAPEHRRDAAVFGGDAGHDVGQPEQDAGGHAHPEEHGDVLRHAAAGRTRTGLQGP